MVDTVKPFDRDTIRHAFEEIGRRACADGKIVEIAVYGGSAVVLTLPARATTKDVDAVFEQDKSWLRPIVKDIADQFGWPADWLNDGVKGFLSPRDGAPDAKALLATYPDAEDAGLRVFVPVPEYLFAMKAMAMRIGGVDEPQDVSDIRALGAEIGIETAEQAIALVEAFYPRSRISPKTKFGLEELYAKPRDK